MKNAFPLDRIGIPVTTKRDFVQRYVAGEFGNRGPTYVHLDEFRHAACPEKRYALRSMIPGGECVYDLEFDACAESWRRKINKMDWYAGEMAPTEKTLIQGEVLQTERGIEFFCSTVAKPMRDALALDSQRLSGIIAVATLRRYLCPNSLEWLYVLLERYPFHVVELSTYSTNWGTLPRYNTAFWEVRKY